MVKPRHRNAILVTPCTKCLPQWQDWDWIGIDGGWKVIAQTGRSCRIAIGDFDSSDFLPPQEIEMLRHPVRKDQTDTELAIEWALQQGYEKIVVWGGLSGRLDHTLANLRMISWKAENVVLMDEMQKVHLLKKGENRFTGEYPHVSFFALEPSCLSLEGFQYDLCRQFLDQKDFYTCSNAVREKEAAATVWEGRVLCVQSRYP